MFASFVKIQIRGQCFQVLNNDDDVAASPVTSSYEVEQRARLRQIQVRSFFAILFAPSMLQILNVSNCCFSASDPVEALRRVRPAARSR
jgi:hypothetical protein